MADPVTVEIDGQQVEVIPSSEHSAAVEELQSQVESLTGRTQGWADDKGEFIAPNWTDDEALREKFSSIPALVGGYKNAVQLVGKDKVVRPEDGASEEIWNEYFKAGGRPDDPEGYELPKPEDEDIPWSEERAEGFKKLAHSLGLSQKQVEGLSKWDLEGIIEGRDSLQAQQQEAQEAASAALKKDWGGLYDRNMETAQRAAKFLGGDELLSEPQLADNPMFIKMMQKCGEIIGEKKLVGNREGLDGFDGDPQRELDMIMSGKDRDSDLYYNSEQKYSDAERAPIKARVKKLNELLHPEN